MNVRQICSVCCNRNKKTVIKSPIILVNLSLTIHSQLYFVVPVSTRDYVSLYSVAKCVASWVVQLAR